MRLKLRLALLLTLTAVLFATASAAGSIKKWVDENGVTHYGTSVPPQYKDQAHSELNARGIEIKRHERALTAEEIEQQKALARLRAEQQKLLEEQQARDRILLNLYRNEDDLLMARDGKLAQIDAQNTISRKEIQRLKDRLSQFQAEAARAERVGKRLSKKQQANLDSTRRSIEGSYAMILGREDEKRAIIDSYESDLARFRKLRHGSLTASTASVVAAPETPDLVDTALRCRDEASCDAMWEKAQAYARQHATTAIDLAAERILVAAPPRGLPASFSVGEALKKISEHTHN